MLMFEINIKIFNGDTSTSRTFSKPKLTTNGKKTGKKNIMK